MPTPRLPRTSVRLATSASFYTMRESDISLSSFFVSIFNPRQEIQEIQRKMRQVFGLLSFEEDQNRTLEHRYEVDSNVRGEPLEVLVQPVARSFTIRRPTFYKDTIISVLGFEDELRRAGTRDAGLLSQQLRDPFIFIKTEAAPEGSGIATTVTFYRGCKLGYIRQGYNVEGGGDLAVYEEAQIYYAGRQSFTQ